MLDVLLLAVGLLVIALIIAANGYFVAQEFAYMSVDRSGLRAAAEKGDASSRRALKVTNRTSFMLSGAQLGITITGLMVGYVAEPLVGESIGRLLGNTGLSLATGIAVGTIVALALATVAQMIFGELFPKNLAIANPSPLARALARSTLIYLRVFGWLIAFFDHSSNALLRLIRVEPVHDLDSSANAEDLEYIVENSRESGDLPADLSILLDRILDFPERDVEHAMVPRSQADFVSPDTSIAEARALMATAHTRYPVLSEKGDPLGVIQLADVLACQSDDTRPVSELMRPPLVVPGLMKLPDALAALVSSKNELACVIDEYGGFTGVITLEDLGEELVGELSDEHDGETAFVSEQIDERSWRVAGHLQLDELERILGHELPEGDFETLGGLLVATRGGLIDVGETIGIVLPESGAELAEGKDVPLILIAEVIEREKYVPTMVRIDIREQVTDEEATADNASADDEGNQQ